MFLVEKGDMIIKSSYIYIIMPRESFSDKALKLLHCSRL